MGQVQGMGHQIKGLVHRIVRPVAKIQTGLAKPAGSPTHVITQGDQFIERIGAATICVAAIDIVASGTVTSDIIIIGIANPRHLPLRHEL
jgi:hypothetical protein